MYHVPKATIFPSQLPVENNMKELASSTNAREASSRMVAVQNLEKCGVSQGQGTWIGEDPILPPVALLKQLCFPVSDSALY